MTYMSHTIKGIPYTKDKVRGDTDGVNRWVDSITKQTEHLPHVRDACLMKVTFFLPPDKYPTNFPFGPNLDNLLKSFLDALEDTIFKEASGGVSCVLSLTAMKTKTSLADVGAHFEILPVTIT